MVQGVRAGEPGSASRPSGERDGYSATITEVNIVGIAIILSSGPLKRVVFTNHGKKCSKPGTVGGSFRLRNHIQRICVLIPRRPQQNSDKPDLVRRGGAARLVSLKTPTSVLLNPEGEFDKFGFEAEDKYATLAEDDEHHGWRLFRRFKMVLHNNEHLTKDVTVEDFCGEQMTAFPLFVMSIKYLKEHLLKAVTTQKIGLEETDILFVLTVPAIWDDNAKRFMRDASIEAGVDPNHLKLALEPECASIWCETLGTDVKGAVAFQGSQFMVVDLGGGTADISVHERKPDGTLKEIHKASGGPWGGIYVDENYM
ncbi:heat shock 70 kDa protein 12B-like [Mya arenaria]|uniref:heat shock 70 kDa protein 12B-like n=1 Tax=Mya arenaria TaxID=6604 RepID=UPI0022E12D39|nr:heat shock 70 kDa protein 12B-like [Mya arenaria]